MTTNKKNKNLNEAKRVKNDEFYTRYDDVVNELMKYEDQLRDKPILMPCDHDFNALTKEQLEEFNQNNIKPLDFTLENKKKHKMFQRR